MADPNASDSLDDTLAAPLPRPTTAPAAPSPTDDFSVWTWNSDGAPAPTLPSIPPASSATTAPPFDETLVNPPLAADSVPTSAPDELDQTLANPPARAVAPDATAFGLDATLVKPTQGPHREDTRVPEEPEDQTLVHPSEPSVDPHATAGPTDGTLIRPVTSDRPHAAPTKPLGKAKPTGVPDDPSPGASGTGPNIPSFRADGDRYEVLGTLGRGGMGVVYKARDRQLNRLVALKMILSGAHASPETLMRFRIEAEAVAKLQHPNIVQIFDIGERDGHPFFSLEYLDGGSLHQKLDGAPQQPKQAAALIETLARASHYAHLHGIVHRDMKPANVLLGADGTLKITDFGLAKQLDAEDSGQTGTEAILGTPTYMAPEQAAGRTKEVGPAADVYALGAMLYEMLTGRPPFRGTTIMDTLRQVQFIEPVQPRRLQPNAPLDLQTICLKCLNKEPQKRYASAEALADDLRAYLENRPIKARPTPALERVYKWTRRQPLQAALVGVIFLALCGLLFGVVLFIRKQAELLQAADKTAQAEIAARAAEEDKRKKAEEDQRIIGRQLVEVRDAKQTAENNATLARSNEQRARDNFKQAQAAVDQLTILAQQSLVDRPGLEKVRDDLLNRVVRFYEEFIKTNQEESLSLEKGQAYRRLGDVQQMLGKNDAAAASYQQASDSFADQLTKDSKAEAPRRELAETSIGLWVVLDDLGKPDLAGRALDQAQTALTELHAAFPDKAAYLLDLAMCANDLAIRGFKVGKLGDAERHGLDALNYLKEAKGSDAKTPAFRLERGRARDALGLLYTVKANTAEHPDEERSKAADQFALALTDVKPLVAQSPETTKYVKVLGEIYTNLGSLLRTRPDKADALNIYGEAIDLFDGLSKKYPDVTDYRQLLAVNRSNRGSLLGQQKQYDAARSDLEAAAAALTQLAAAFPKRPIYRLDLARTYDSLGLIFAAARQRDSARQHWEQAEKLLEDLVRARPKRDDYRKELRRALDFLILLHDQQTKEFIAAKQWTQAAAATAQLIDLYEKMGTLFPNEGSRQADLASARLTLAANQLRAGNLSEADKTLAELQKQRKDVPAQWGKWYEVAKVAYACLELADRDPQLSPEARARLREGRTLQCLLLLRDALDDNENRVINPDDFKTLRDNPDFKELLAESERKNKKAGDAP